MKAYNRCLHLLAVAPYSIRSLYRYVDAEKLLPEEIRARDTKFVIVSMDGTVGEVVAAVL